MGPLSGRWSDLGEAAGSEDVGVCRIQVTPGKRSTPLHLELVEEEIFFVLGGSGLSWQWEGEDPLVYEVAEGDCLVHLAGEAAHTLVAGPHGLDVLAFGMRVAATGTWLPRAGVVRVPPTWVETPGGKHPWEREAAAGDEKLPDPLPRPASIVNVRETEAREVAHGEFVFVERELASVARRTGLNHHSIRPHKWNWPFHTHSAEEEIFVVLEGEGVCRLGEETIPVHRGSVVARPAGTGVSHAFQAGADRLELLAYGTRDGRDIAWYPDSHKVNFRAFGFTARIEPVGYWD
jgi:uncharacterized cupin superfamily protein